MILLVLVYVFVLVLINAIIRFRISRIVQVSVNLLQVSVCVLGLMRRPHEQDCYLATRQTKLPLGLSDRLSADIDTNPPIWLALGVLTSSVQKDWSNVAQSSLDLGFLGVVPRFSGSSASLDLGFFGLVLLCSALLCLARDKVKQSQAKPSQAKAKLS